MAISDEFLIEVVILCGINGAHNINRAIRVARKTSELVRERCARTPCCIECAQAIRTLTFEDVEVKP